MKAILLGGIVLVAGFAVAFALPRNEVVGLLDLTKERLPAPPELNLVSPAQGEGVGAQFVLAGQALSVAREVIDVQYRLDGGRWTSIPDVPRGQRSAPFSLSVPVEKGDHLIEARAWDGEAHSLVARALVRRDAPTIRIVSPTHGEGVPSGVVEVTGHVVGAAQGVVVESAGHSVETNLSAGGTWSARLPLDGGLRTIRATALANVPSLPAEVRVAAGKPTPPTLTILSPREGAAYGETGDIACGGGCILFSGTSRDATSIDATLDGLPAGQATLLPTGAWTYRLPMVRLASGPHTASFAAPGSAPQNVTFLARTSLALDIRGDLAPALTHTRRDVEVGGEGATGAEWSFDGTPAGNGAATSLLIGRPGDHTLSVRTPVGNGASATASVTLHALNRAPVVSLAQPALVGSGIRLEAIADDADGRVVSYRWTFGDGAFHTSKTPTVEHRYLARGLYVANVTAVDDGGLTSDASTIVLVPNVLPLANFSWAPSEPTMLDVVTFNDTSLDVDGALVSRVWSLPGGNTSSNATPALRFPTRGPHPITLEIVDDFGARTSLTQLVHVANLPPVARFSWIPTTPRAHEEVFFVDNSTDLDGPLAKRLWDFGDGDNGTGAGAVHTYRAPGLYNVTLTIVDDFGAKANITLPLRVSDGEPTITAVIAQPPRPTAQETVQLSVLATDREGSVVGLQWDFGDGTNSTQREPRHVYPRSGTYAGRVTVYDEAGLSTTFPFILEIANAKPTGTVALVKGGYAAFPSTIVANATDPDGRVALYRFDADGDGITDCETTTPECIFTYERAGAHLLRVWIEDDEAAIHEAHAIVDILTPPSHLAPPRVLIASPTNGATMRGEYLLRGDAEGVRPIAKVELQFRNGSWAYSGAKDAWRLAQGGLAWSTLLDTRGLADGEYDLIVRATDTDGGQGLARTRVHILNGARPSDVTLQILDAPTSLDDDTTIRGSAFHPQGVTSVRWRIDENPWRYIATSPLAFTIPLERDQLDPGPHLLTIEAYHGPTQKATHTHHFQVDGTAPSLVIDTPPAPTAYALLHANGRIVGPGHAQWRLDHGIWHDLPGNGTWNLTEDTLQIQGGQHTLDLRATSPDGRLTSATRTYTIQIVNPPFDSDATPARAKPPPITLDVPLPMGALLAAATIAAATRAGGRRR